MDKVLRRIVSVTFLLSAFIIALPMAIIYGLYSAFFVIWIYYDEKLNLNPRNKLNEIDNED